MSLILLEYIRNIFTSYLKYKDKFSLSTQSFLLAQLVSSTWHGAQWSNSADSRSGRVTYSWLGKVRLRLEIYSCPNYLFTKIFPKASSNFPENTKFEYCMIFFYHCYSKAYLWTLSKISKYVKIWVRRFLL